MEYTKQSPTFTESYKESFKGAPGVEVNYTIKQKTVNAYDFVTSIVIESEQGTPNTPKFINSPQELIDEYGVHITKDMKYCLSFLSYSPSLLVQRSIGKNSFNSSSPDFSLIKINNYTEFFNYSEEDFLQNKTIRFIAQTPGKDGNLLKVSLFTTEELKKNKIIYKDFRAKHIINGMDEMCYCVAIFKDEINGITTLKEVFVIPFNDLESINTQSNLVYVKLNAYNDILDDLYDGNIHTYEGNLLFADGDAGHFFYGYDGNLQLFDGNVVLFDGNDFNNITYIIKYYGDNILSLEHGNTEKASIINLKDSAEELDNTMNYNIDLHIGNNVTLFRKDCVNIVGTPKGVEQAVDFKYIFDTKRSTYTKEPLLNIFYIYGIKVLDKEEINCSGDYAGIRSKEVLTNGLGISTSKITKPLKISRLKTNPGLKEMDYLYQNGINIVYNNKGIIFCNGEIIHEDNI